SCTFRLNEVGVDHASACFCMHQMAPVSFWQQLAFIHDQSTGRAGPKALNVRNHPRQLRMKMGAAIFSPGSTSRSPIAEVAALQDVVQADPGVSVIIVVRLLDVPK